MIVESLFHCQLIVDIYCYRYYIFIVFNTALVLVIPYKTSARYLNYRIVQNIVATTISFSLSVTQIGVQHRSNFTILIRGVNRFIYHAAYVSMTPESFPVGHDSITSTSVP